MTFVLDASAALALVFADEPEGAREVEARFERGDRAIVPRLFLEEIANAFVVAERRGRIDGAQLPGHLTRIARLPINISKRPPSPTGLIELARRHCLSAYDAAYLEIALELRAPLVTGDKALRRAADRAAIRASAR